MISPAYARPSVKKAPDNACLAIAKPSLSTNTLLTLSHSSTSSKNALSPRTPVTNGMSYVVTTSHTLQIRSSIPKISDTCTTSGVDESPSMANSVPPSSSASTTKCRHYTSPWFTQTSAKRLPRVSSPVIPSPTHRSATGPPYSITNLLTLSS